MENSGFGLNYTMYYCELIDFYKPTIVIGERFSLGASLIRTNEKDISVKTWKDLKNRDIFEFHNDFFNWLYAYELGEQSELYFIGKRKINKQDKEKIREKDLKDKYKSYCTLVRDEKDCLWIGWYHPEAARNGEWEDYVKVNMAKFIKRNLP